MDFWPQELSYVVSELNPFTEYTFRVTASTTVGEGPATDITEKTREQGGFISSCFSSVKIAGLARMAVSVSDSILCCVYVCGLVPGSVLNVFYQNISSTSILVSWDPPLNPNGRITHYTVYGLTMHNNQGLKWETTSTSILITGDTLLICTGLCSSN